MRLHAEKRIDDHQGSHTPSSSQSELKMSGSMELPSDCVLQDISACLSNDGLLEIEIKKIRDEIVIPIKRQ